MKYSVYLLLLLFSACSSVTTPDSHYYRLSASDKVKGKSSIDKAYRVSAFKTEGMLNTNNLLYIEKDRPNELMQFHYHQWHAPLSSVLTDNFILYFNATTNSTIFEHDYSSFNGYLIIPVIKSMEIQYSDSSVDLSVNINFKVKQGSKLILSKTYHAKKTYQTKDIYKLVSNYNEVLQQIYKSFVADISLL